MIVQLSSLLAGALLPYVWAGASLPYRSRQFGAPDIREPRVQAEKLQGSGARAWGAQMNAWEALAVFTVANLAAFMAGVDTSGHWALASMFWVGLRTVHGVAYIANNATVRVICFAGAMGMSVWIFVMALMAA